MQEPHLELGSARVGSLALERIVRTLSESVIVHDANGAPIWMNDAARRLDALAGGLSLTDLVWEDGSPVSREESPLALGTGERMTDVIVGLAGHEPPTWLSLNAFSIELDDGTRGGVVAMADVTHRILAAQAHERTQDNLESVLASVDDYLYAWRYHPDGSAETIYESAVQEAILGVPWLDGMDAEEHWRSALHPDDLDDFDNLLMGSQRKGESGSREYRVIGSDGRIRWLQDRWRAFGCDNGSTQAEGIVSDVTDRHEAQSELHELLSTLQSAYAELDEAREHAERQSQTDSLTRLANRRHFLSGFEAALEAGDPSGVLMLDVDHFKRINDEHGHAAGDTVLVEVARRVERSIREGDAAARWGGEEFIIRLPGIEDDESLRRIAAGLSCAISSVPVPLAEGAITVTVSIGAARSSARAESCDVLIELADEAMYNAKHSGRNTTRIAGDPTPASESEEPDAVNVAVALALAASLREGAPARHAEQVGDLAAATARLLGLPPTTVLTCRIAGLLHDVGKVAIPDAILTKPGPLSDGEWERMRTHPIVGEGLVRRVPGLADAALGVRHHHERWDGAGYPDGLRGEEIPLEARIVAAADAFFSMVSDRPYRRRRTRQLALNELRRSAGAGHDARIIAAMTRCIQRMPASGTDDPPLGERQAA